MHESLNVCLGSQHAGRDEGNVSLRGTERGFMKGHGQGEGGKEGIQG